MSDIFFLVLRRMRVPLILLISVYSIATLGMTLIPGIDPDGEPYRMSFFHAFYFVSFMGTTIGFGEIPYPFTDAQRAWVLGGIYTSVIAWLYAIGNMLRLVQDETFIAAVSQRAFQGSIQRIDQPFYIICGFGETGQIINRGLVELNLQTIIIDHDAERTRSLELENLTIAPIVLTADITEPSHLIKAGINNVFCRGVVAVTENDHTNLQIAVASKLVNKRVPVICRSEIEDEANNMASFGTDVIINPYFAFARRLSLLTQNPELHRIQDWFINQHSTEHIAQDIAERGLPHGRWILCGYGRFGRAIYEALETESIEIVVVDIDPIENRAPSGAIVGRGTEAKTLEEAGIDEAAVIIAGSDDDANNLSILITAKQLKSDIVTIGRVSKEANHDLFVHAECDYIMRRSQVIANEVLTAISRPLVSKFIKFSNRLEEVETEHLIREICALTHNTDPVTWRLIIDEKNAPALVRLLDIDKPLTVLDITESSLLPDARCLPLLLQRGVVSHLLPEPTMEIELGDEVLLCSRRGRSNLAQRLSDNTELVDTIINNNTHHIPLLRWWSRRSSTKV